MKTVCKKLLCLMLVAMMLVSAVPFAFAAEAVVCPDHPDAAVAFRGEGAGTAATCTTAGTKGYLCAGEVGQPVNNPKAHNFEVPVAALGHSWGDGVETTPAGCTTEGVKTYTCSACGETKTEAIAANGHDYETVITTAATCTEDGLKTVTCKNNAAHTYTEVIPATGHKMSNHKCTVCGAAEDYIAAITFYYLDSEGNETSAVRYVYEDGATITPPAVPANPKSGFSYWAENANGGGDTINADEALVYNSQTPNAFYAIYNKKSAMSELKIYVVRYVNGVRKEANYLFSEHFTTSNDNNMYQYLWANKDAIRTAAINELGEGYTWNNKFYNYFTDEELTDANLKDNGDKSVYIKMNTKNSNEAQVLIYVHKKATSTVYDILEMSGYNAGEWVYLKDVKNFLDDEGYSWSSTSSLYTDEEWEDLLDGESPSGSNGIKITDNGTYKIHIILKGASNSSADSSNPKTGDNIMIAVTTMTLAAAAMVAMVELKKRKMI